MGGIVGIVNVYCVFFCIILYTFVSFLVHFLLFMPFLLHFTFFSSIFSHFFFNSDSFKGGRTTENADILLAALDALKPDDSQDTLNNIAMRTAAFLVSSEERPTSTLLAADHKLVRALAGLPYKPFVVAAANAAVVAWRWIAAKRPDLGMTLFSEVVSTWNASAAQRIGLFAAASYVFFRDFVGEIGGKYWFLWSFCGGLWMV